MRITFCLSDRKAPIARIVGFLHWDNQQMKVSTGLHVAPKDWNQKKRRTRNTAPGGEQIDAVLASMESNVAELAAKVAATRQRVTREQIRAALTAPTTKRQHSRRLVDLYDVFLEEAKGRLQPGSIGSHRVTRNHVERFEKVYGITLNLDNLDTVHLDKFRSYLLDVRGISNSTLAAQAKNLRVLLNRAVANGETVNPAFKKFRFQTHETRSIALTIAELEQIQTLDLHHEPRLDEARDCFVVQCLTGLRFGDLASIRPENIDGNQLRITARKTGALSVVRILPEAREIFARYEGRLPVPALGSYNERIKQIGLRAGLTAPTQTVTFRGLQRIERAVPKCELLSSHVARRTFVTISLGLGVQGGVVMAATGHKNSTMMQRYNRINEDAAGDELEARWATVKQ